jgi:hypothetical protein
MMRQLRDCILLLLMPALLFWAGCTGPAAEPPRAADGTSSIPVGTTEIEGTESLEDFETIDGDDLEILATPLELTKSEERGLMIFRHYCAHCHGTTGQGDGQNSYGLETPPRDLLILELDGERTDEDLRRVITEGGAANGLSPLMPPWGHTLEPERIDDLVALIHILPELEPVEEGAGTLSLDKDAGMDDFSL